MIELNGSDISLSNLFAIANGEKVGLAELAVNRVNSSRDYIERRIGDGEAIYGINTGFGSFSSVRISQSDLNQLQINLVRSHCVGVGTPFSKLETRAIMALRANALARGHSGVRREVIEKLIEFLNHDILPVIPSQGSVGASGDLAPLAHLALGLIGEGLAWNGDQHINMVELLKQKKLSSLKLMAKEGLSLINGCQVMTAIGGLQCLQAIDLCRIADVVGAMTLEGLRGSRSAFHPSISSSRPHKGEIITARNILRILGKESEISRSHQDCSRVQDAYSVRCMPAVHGAVKDAVRSAVHTLEVEANSSTDNPLVFVDENLVVSCGNFHGEPVAFQLDFLAIALSALANISERRIAKLINPSFSELPAFLTQNGGLQSGMMIVQVAAASLVSENKIYAHPASVDSISTSVDKEDHVSMGATAARKLKLICDNTRNVLSMEALCALTALRLLEPLQPAFGVLRAKQILEAIVPPIVADRVFATDVNNICETFKNGEFLRQVQKETGDLEW